MAKKPTRRPKRAALRVAIIGMSGVAAISCGSVLAQSVQVAGLGTLFTTNQLVVPPPPQEPPVEAEGQMMSMSAARPSLTASPQSNHVGAPEGSSESMRGPVPLNDETSAPPSTVDSIPPPDTTQAPGPSTSPAPSALTDPPQGRPSAPEVAPSPNQVACLAGASAEGLTDDATGDYTGALIRVTAPECADLILKPLPITAPGDGEAASHVHAKADVRYAPTAAEMALFPAEPEAGPDTKRDDHAIFYYVVRFYPIPSTGVTGWKVAVQ
jgi:hypothetical protein